MIAGIDYSSRAVDIVLLDEDTDAAEWHRFELLGENAFDRTRDVRNAMICAMPLWDDVLAIGIEDPRGHGSGSLYRIQGAILARLPRRTLVHPWVPSAWRKAVGLPGNASKLQVKSWVDGARVGHALWDDPERPYRSPDIWPQDACDAYCIALATRAAIQVTA